MSLNVNTFNAPVAAMLDTAAFNALFVQPAFDFSKIRAPAVVARGDQWTGKHLWSMSGHHEPKADKQPLIGLGLGWPVGQTFTSFIEETETLTVNPHTLDFLITPPLQSSTWTRTTSALSAEATAFVPGSSTSNLKITKLNPKATTFTPRHTRKSLDPTAVEFVPSSMAFGLNPRATEFIPRAASQSVLSQVTPRRTRFPRAPRMIAPSVSEETWDCAEFMDTLASFDLFEELEMQSQSDELTSDLEPSAEEFVPGWINTSIEAQELGEPVRSTGRRTTRRVVKGTLQPQVSEETWDYAEFMDSLEPHIPYEEAFARIQSEDRAAHPTPPESEFPSHWTQHSEAASEALPRPILMSRSLAVFKARILGPPHELEIVEGRGSDLLHSPLVVQPSATDQYWHGEWVDYHTTAQLAASEPKSKWSLQSDNESFTTARESIPIFNFWIHLIITLLALLPRWVVG